MIKSSRYGKDVALLSSVSYLAGTYGEWWVLVVIVIAGAIVFFVSRPSEAREEP